MALWLLAFLNKYKPVKMYMIMAMSFAAIHGLSGPGYCSDSASMVIALNNKILSIMWGSRLMSLKSNKSGL